LRRKREASEREQRDRRIDDFGCCFHVFCPFVDFLRGFAVSGLRKSPDRFEKS